MTAYPIVFRHVGKYGGSTCEYRPSDDETPVMQCFDCTFPFPFVETTPYQLAEWLLSPKLNLLQAQFASYELGDALWSNDTLAYTADNDDVWTGRHFKGHLKPGPNFASIPKLLERFWSTYEQTYGTPTAPN